MSSKPSRGFLIHRFVNVLHVEISSSYSSLIFFKKIIFHPFANRPVYLFANHTRLASPLSLHIVRTVSYNRLATEAGLLRPPSRTPGNAIAIPPHSCNDRRSISLSGEKAFRNAVQNSFLPIWTLFLFVSCSGHGRSLSSCGASCVSDIFRVCFREHLAQSNSIVSPSVSALFTSEHHSSL